MMRRNPRFAACLMVSFAGLLFVFSDSVWTQETTKDNPKIKELQKQRLAVLKQVHDVAKKSFQNARVSFEAVHAAKVELLAARRDYAETKKDRIAACDEAVHEALEWQKMIQAMAQSARAQRIDELKAEAFILEAQIARAKAETDK